MMTSEIAIDQYAESVTVELYTMRSIIKSRSTAQQLKREVVSREKKQQQL